VYTSSAAFLVHWLNSCDSLLSYLYYVYVDSDSYLKKKIPLFRDTKRTPKKNVMLLHIKSTVEDRHKGRETMKVYYETERAR